MSRFYFSTNHGASWYSTRSHTLRSAKRAAISDPSASPDTSILLGLRNGDYEVTPLWIGQPGNKRRTWSKVAHFVPINVK